MLALFCGILFGWHWIDAHRTRPTNDEEKAFYVIAVLMGAFVHATIFGQVAHLVSIMSRGVSEFNQHMHFMYDRMEYHGIPPALKRRVASYFESLWERHR